MKSKRTKVSRVRRSKELDLVANFMNLPAEFAEVNSKGPILMHDLVEQVWNDWGIGEDETPEHIISGNWQKIVGKNLFAKCAPVKLSKDRKTLYVRAATSTIKQELSLKKASVLQKINSLKKCRNVTFLRIS